MVIQIKTLRFSVGSGLNIRGNDKAVDLKITDKVIIARPTRLINKNYTMNQTAEGSMPQIPVTKPYQQSHLLENCKRRQCSSKEGELFNLSLFIASTLSRLVPQMTHSILKLILINYPKCIVICLSLEILCIKVKRGVLPKAME